MIFALSAWKTISTPPQLIIGLGVIAVAVGITVIVNERHHPSAAMSWIMVVFLFPLLGTVLYFLLSRNAARRKIFVLNKYEQKEIDESLSRQIDEICDGRFMFSNEEGSIWKRMIRLNQIYGRAYYTQDNCIKIMTDGENFLDTLLEDIYNARETISVMFFIIKNDETGRRFIDALTEKARQGVQVRLLMDSMGSWQINDRILKDFIDAGGKRTYFFPRRFKLLHFRFNCRNHRKLAVIDDKIGYIGGFNVADEYLGKRKKFGHWRDTHIRIEGQAVQDINARFILDWRFSSKEDMILSGAYYSGVSCIGKSGIQIVSSGPDSLRDEVKRGFMKMITSAETNIFLQTPYFVPDTSILESLKMAAQSGVDVKLMIPCMPDHPFVYWATLDNAGELLNSGGRVYIYEDGFLHSKAMVVDGEVVTVGSANCDRRSFELNFESNAFIYDKKEAHHMERIFLEDIDRCRELTKEEYDRRNIITRSKEVVSRLLSDFL